MDAASKNHLPTPFDDEHTHFVRVIVDGKQYDSEPQTCSRATLMFAKYKRYAYNTIVELWASTPKCHRIDFEDGRI